MTFRVKMEFTLGAVDLEVVQKALGRNHLSAADIKAYLTLEYHKEVGDGAQHEIVIEVTEVPGV